MKVVSANDVKPQEQNRERWSPRTGGTIMQLIMGIQTDDGLDFRIVRSQFQSGEKAFRTPRHTHAFQQFRFTEKGLNNHDPNINAAEGDIVYFPQGAWYGPQEKNNGIGVALQYGFNGEHQMGPKWEALRPKALELLASRGKTEHGIYAEIDPKTGNKIPKDAVQALYDAQWELAKGEKFVVPPPKYDAPILMHPPAFHSYQLSPGVEVKHLGRFFDQPGPNGDARINQVHLSDEGKYLLEADRHQTGWALPAGLEINGIKYPERTFFYCPRGEEAELSSKEPVEVFVIEFPKLD